MQDFAEFEDPWFVIHFVDETVAEVTINIIIRDEDDTKADGFYKDDICDINPKTGKSDLDFRFKLKDGSLSGDLNGLFPTQTNSFVVSGTKPDKNRAIFKAYLQQFPLR